MKILETFTIPQPPYLALRWTRGSGLQGRDNHLRDLRLDISIDPAYGTRIVGKAGYCLVIGDVTDRAIEIRDPAQAVNPRAIDLTTLAAANAASAGTGSGTGGGTATGSASGTGSATAIGSGTADAEAPAAIGAAAALQDLALYETQHRIRFGAAGGIRGRLAIAAEAYLPWVLVTATYGHVEGTQRFVTQADAKGEFAIDLAGIKRPDDNGPLTLTLSVEAASDLQANTPPDPAAFVAYRISPDGTTAQLGASIDVTLQRYGRTVKLGDVLIAPAT